jgi:hypothetical protein
MGRIGWIDLLQSISHLGSLSVGKQPSMNESARVTTNANGLGTSVMTEGRVLILTMVICVVGTLLLNAVVQGVIG